MSATSDRISETLKLGSPAQRALDAAGIVTFADLALRTRAEVGSLHGMGPKSFVALDPAMAARGIDYRAP